MRYTYKVQELSPKQEFMIVVYSADGYPDYTKTYNPREFTEEALRTLIEGQAWQVIEFWLRWENHPETAPMALLEGEAEGEPTELKDLSNPPPYEEEPPYDYFTEKLVPDAIDWDKPTIGWSVVPLTEAEKAEHLANWRVGVYITNAEFRTALFRADAIDRVEAGILGYSEEEEQLIRIQWEHAPFVYRNSELCLAVQAFTGMSDDEMDSIFKAVFGL